MYTGCTVFAQLAVSTGLRHKELRSLKLGQLFLDAQPAPYFELYANQSMSGKESRLPLRGDVVEKIRQHMEHRSKQGYKALLFDNPPGIRVFDAVCQAAGISKTDAPGRVVDIHALHTTFGTHLAVAGVHPPCRPSCHAAQPDRADHQLLHRSGVVGRQLGG